MPHSEVQSVRFARERFTTAQARAWLKRNCLHPIKRVDVARNELRYRIRPPKYRRYVTIDATTGVHFILGYR